METTIAKEILADPFIADSVGFANQILLKGVACAPHPPRAVWRLVRRKKKSDLIEVELFFHHESRARQFSFEDLNDPIELRYRLSDLWGDLILRCKTQTIARLAANLGALEEMEATHDTVGEGRQDDSRSDR